MTSKCLLIDSKTQDLSSTILFDLVLTLTSSTMFAREPPNLYLVAEASKKDLAFLLFCFKLDRVSSSRSSSTLLWEILVRLRDLLRSEQLWKQWNYILYFITQFYLPQLLYFGDFFIFICYFFPSVYLFHEFSSLCNIYFTNVGFY